MIPVANTLTQVDTLDVEEEIEFEIGDARWVMRTQSDMYSNRELAVTREYSTNAYDANREQALLDGTPVRPIEVTLPSMMNPHFIVRDHGPGMGIDALRHTYTKFGVSTKRDSNEYNGQLGYGSKSGVAYTNTFTVTSVHEGVKRVAVVVRKPDWSIVMKILSTSLTDEASGTEINVPVHNWEQFSTVAKDFYKFWLPGRVLVNGVEPAHNVGDKITENLYFSPSWDRSYVVMGNVPYRIENSDALFQNVKMRSIDFVAYVDDISRDDGVAAVEFTPSREDLKYTDRTLDTLHKVIKDFSENILATAQSEIDNSANHAEAFVNWKKWTGHLGMNMFDALEYKGDALEHEVKVNAARYATAGYRNATYRVNEWNVDSFEKTLVVTDFNVATSSAAKSKAKEYASQMGWNISYVLFTSQSDSDIKSPWISRDKFVTWDDLKAALPKTVKVSGGYTVSGRIPGSFDYYDDQGFKHIGQPLPAGEVRFVTIRENKQFQVNRIIKESGFKGSVIILGQNRVTKFKRDYPQAPNLITWAKDKVIIKSEVLLSADAKTLIAQSETVRVWARKLDASKIDDPNWENIAKLVANSENLLADYKANLALANVVGLGYTVQKYSPSVTESLLAPYPLLGSLSAYGMSTNLDHVILYINAAYAAESEQSND